MIANQRTFRSFTARSGRGPSISIDAFLSVPTEVRVRLNELASSAITDWSDQLWEFPVQGVNFALAFNLLRRNGFKRVEA